MNESRPLTIPLAQDCKLSAKIKLDSEVERDKMNNIPCASVVGSIVYTMVCTRLDLSHPIVLSRFMVDSGLVHWSALNKVMRYLKEIVNLEILLEKNRDKINRPLIGFVDLDFASSVANRRSLTDFLFTLFGATINWKSSL